MTDFVLYGEVERDEHGEVGLQALRHALLNHNPRRNLQSRVVLSSNHGGGSHFVAVPSGLTSAPESGRAAAPSAAKPTFETPPCTDFVIVDAMAAVEPDGTINIANLVTSLLKEPQSNISVNMRLTGTAGTLGKENRRTRVTLTSNNGAKGAHFVMAGLCSTHFTSADIAYTERVAQVKAGTFFKTIRLAKQSEKEKVNDETEYTYDPVRRYQALAKVEKLRGKRGSKSAEHLKNLRQSDPLIRLCAWHDWGALRDAVRRSYAARIHQQRLIDRGMRAHAMRTANLLVENTTSSLEDDEAKHTAYISHLSASHNRARSLKHELHLGRLHTVDESGPTGARSSKRDERSSSDSVISFFDAPPSPKQTEANSPSSVMGNNPYGATWKGKPSNKHVPVPPMNLEKVLPPLE